MTTLIAGGLWRSLERCVHGLDPWPKLARPGLFGLSLVWTAAARIREVAYTRAFPRLLVTKLPAPLVVSVGNVSVGGTGKTPMVEFLGRILTTGCTKSLQSAQAGPGAGCMVLTRGYGGDEEHELRDALPGAAVIAGPERSRLAAAALARTPTSRSVRAVLLDDGLQHFQLHRDVNIVMVNARRGCRGQYAHVLPYGPLREPWRRGLKRADAVVLHHATSIEPGTFDALCKDLKAIRPGVRVFASEMRHYGPVPDVKPRSILCLTGVGCPDAVEDTARSVFRSATQSVETLWFGDHHQFTLPELEAARAEARRSGALVVTTAKDYHRAPALFDRVFAPKEIFVMRARLHIVGDRAAADFVDLVRGANL